MNILLIAPNHRNIVSPSYMQAVQKGLGHLPPLGLLFLAGYLREKTRHNVHVYDALLEDAENKDIVRVIGEIKPDVVGIHAITFALPDVLGIAGLIRKINPDTKIVVGGPHATVFPIETIAFPEIDYVVVGEGEIPFARLVNYLEKPETEPAAIPGVIGKEHELGAATQPYVNENLDNLPFPARDLTPYRQYKSVVSIHPPTTTIMGSRGCPYRCTFCHTAGGKKYRPRSPENIITEMQQCLNLGIREFFFFDETFTLDRDRVISFCRSLIDTCLASGQGTPQSKPYTLPSYDGGSSGTGIYWDVRARVDLVDPEMLGWMKKAGCQRIQFGVESGSDKVLKRLNKSSTTKQASQAISWTKEVGISTYADFMIGNPGETMMEIEETFRFAKALDTDYVHYSITMPLPGTPLYDEALNMGIIKEDYWREFSKNPMQEFKVKYWEENFTADQLEKLLKRGYREFYLRPRYIAKTLSRLRSPGEFLRKAKAGLKIMKDI